MRNAPFFYSLLFYLFYPHCFGVVFVDFFNFIFFFWLCKYLNCCRCHRDLNWLFRKVTDQWLIEQTNKRKLYLDTVFRARDSEWAETTNWERWKIWKSYEFTVSREIFLKGSFMIGWVKWPEAIFFAYTWWIDSGRVRVFIFLMINSLFFGAPE